ncbi:hypothetical protein [Clostridium pasteurianum]|uniref:Uncharacterized protein n=1 Tax=Clostridium pasteurianum BC1 TaxID=86416 RepID=R4K6A6_CLOPA|nr:hypothetical protein [Clostridium pasteurianum]AGK97246.1 hypothetical protein Clopa_2383 [Clostridium pasteurianum BC1]
MSKRSMVKTSPEKVKLYDDRNPENKDTQSIQTNELNESSYAFGKNDVEDSENNITR